MYRCRLLPRPLLSSTELGWRGLVVERYQMPPCELPDLPVAHHIVELASQQHVSLGERPNWRGHLRPFSKYPGICNLFPDGIRPKLRSFTQTNLIVCGLDPDFVEEVSQELNLNPVAQLRVQIDIRDESLGYLKASGKCGEAWRTGCQSLCRSLDLLVHLAFVLSRTRQAIYVYTPRGVTSS